MKLSTSRNWLYCLLFLLPFTGLAQTVNGVPLKDVDVEYIQIVGTSKLMSTKLTIEIDFGQEDKYWNRKDIELRDANDNRVEFNSMIDALNFLSAPRVHLCSGLRICSGQSERLSLPTA